MKTVDICIPTFPAHIGRVECFLTTTRLLREKMSASRHNLRFYVSCEPVNLTPRKVLRSMLVSACDYLQIQFQDRQAAYCDLGANMNYAMQMGEGDYVLMCQDDMALQSKFDVSDYCDFLDSNPHALVRFGYAQTQFLPCDDPLVNEVDMAGPWPFADEPWLQRRSQLLLYAEGFHHGGQEGEMSSRLVQARARIAASKNPLFSHGWMLSTIESRMREEMMHLGIKGFVV